MVRPSCSAHNQASKLCEIECFIGCWTYCTVLSAEMHCQKHFPAHLNNILLRIGKNTNYTKSLTVNTEGLQKVCPNLGSNFEVLLFYSAVW